MTGKQSPSPKSRSVDLDGRTYPVYVGPGLIEQAGELCEDMLDAPAFIITDEKVGPLYGDKLHEALCAIAPTVHRLDIPEGEASKSMEIYTALTDWLLGNGVRRQSPVFALGGGVVGDLAGFAAATTLRGLPFVQVPTTLLAQVDSAVGGKTGINSRFGKNLIGAFHQPKCVLADLSTLQTLPGRQLRAGYAEILKYGLIRDAGFFDWLEKYGKPLISGERDSQAFAVDKSCAVKADIVAADEHESGLRMILNFGHTFGHVFEWAAGYDATCLLHGEGVALGMICAARLSARLGYIGENDVARIVNHIESVGLPTRLGQLDGFPDIGTEELIRAMQSDKKADAGGVRFVILRGIGHAEIVSGLDPATLTHVLEEIY